MKYTKIIMSVAVLSVTALNAGWMDTVNEGLNAMKENPDTKNTKTESLEASNMLSSLSTSDMNDALKEALDKGVKYALDALGKENGYLSNAKTKISLPDNLQKTAELVKKAGGEKYVDDLILAINNAATEAAPKTAEIFSKSIADMGIEDAKKILSGSDNAATDYFKSTTTSDLQATIAPIIQKSMDNNEVAKYYDQFQAFYKEHAGVLKNEYVSSAANLLGYGGVIPSEKDEDINQFITNKSIDGIMVKIEEEEKKIRDNPLMQNNELIGKVFSVFE